MIFYDLYITRNELGVGGGHITLVFWTEHKSKTEKMQAISVKIMYGSFVASGP